MINTTANIAALAASAIFLLLLGVGVAGALRQIAKWGRH